MARVQGEDRESGALLLAPDLDGAAVLLDLEASEEPKAEPATRRPRRLHVCHRLNSVTPNGPERKSAERARWARRRLVGR